MAAGLVATGRDAKAVARERESARELLAFLFSTPSYWPALEIHGCKAVGERLHALGRAGKWGEMTAQIDDALLAALIPCGGYEEISDVLKQRYGVRATHLTFPMPVDRVDDDSVARVISTLKSDASAGALE